MRNQPDKMEIKLGHHLVMATALLPPCVKVRGRHLPCVITHPQAHLSPALAVSNTAWAKDPEPTSLR